MSAPKRARLGSFLPAAEWLPRYDRKWLRTDIVAGLAVWAMMVPQALAYAGLAGVPPVYGLYSVPFAMLAYAFFGTSRTMCVGPESAIAIISAVTVGAIAMGNPSEYLALTALLTLIVAGLFLAFGLLRLGWLSNFLSQPVLQGFTQGIALIVIVGQFPSIFGTEEAFRSLMDRLGESLPTGFFTQAWAVVATLSQAKFVTAAIGLSGLALLFALKRFRPQAPASLIVVLLSVLVVSLVGSAEHSIRVLGEVETGMMKLSLPAIDLEKIAALLPGAFAIVLLGYSVSLSVAAVGAESTGEEIDSNQELVALGVSNLGAALSSGFVVCGSLSRGVVIRRAGGRTQVVSMVNAVLVLLTLIFLLPLFYRLPYAILAAVVVQAMTGLLNFSYFRKLYRINRGEFFCGIATLLAVITLGILQGVAVGVILSLVMLIRRVSHPGTAVLGKIPGTGSFRDLAVEPDAEPFPGLLIFRFDAPIIFPNAGYFVTEIRRQIGATGAPIREVLIPAQQINQLDSTGADKLKKLHAELEKKGIALSFAEMKQGLAETFRSTGLRDQIGADRFHDTIEEGVRAFQQSHD